MSLVKLYPDDFSKDDMRDLSHQLRLYIADVRADNRFSNINTIGELSQNTTTERLICPGWEIFVVPVSQPGTPGRDKRGGPFVPGLATGTKITLLSRLVTLFSVPLF